MNSTKEQLLCRRVLRDIKTRCNNPLNRAFKWYGARGVKCLLTIKEVEYLFKRDKADLLKQPSINRKDNDGNYCLDNCEFIEQTDNIAERNRRICSKSINQYDLSGNLIKNWPSLREVERILGIPHANIHKVLKRQNKQAGGFHWKYKDSSN